MIVEKIKAGGRAGFQITIGFDHWHAVEETNIGKRDEKIFCCWNIFRFGMLSMCIYESLLFIF